MIETTWVAGESAPSVSGEDDSACAFLLRLDTGSAESSVRKSIEAPYSGYKEIAPKSSSLVGVVTHRSPVTAVDPEAKLNRLSPLRDSEVLEFFASALSPSFGRSSFEPVGRRLRTSSIVPSRRCRLLPSAPEFLRKRSLTWSRSWSSSAQTLLDARFRGRRWSFSK